MRERVLSPSSEDPGVRGLPQHIRDRLVVYDKELSRGLQVMLDFALETAVQMVQQADDVAQQMSQQQAAFSVQEMIHW